MELSIFWQISEAAGSFLLGSSAGLFYDFLKVIRHRMKNSLVTFLLDMVFWTVVGFAVFLFGMIAGGGKLRLFMLLFAFLGGLLYLRFLSAYTTAALNAFLDFLLMLWGYLTLPVRLFINLNKKFFNG